MSRFCYTNVPENGTKGRDGTSRAHKGTGTLSRPGSCPDVSRSMSRFAGAANDEKAHCLQRQADLYAGMDDMAEWASKAVHT